MENQLERPSFWAVIPADVRYSKVLSSSAKLLYAEITCLCNKAGVCWAGNKYFADLYATTERSITRWIAELIDAGYIVVAESTKANGRRYLKPTTKMSMGVDKNVQGGTTKMSTQPQMSNTLANKKTNNKTNVKAFLLSLIALVNQKEKPTDDRIRVLNGRLKDYTEAEITAAAVAFSKSEWHKENKQMSIDNLLAPSKFGRWYEQSTAGKPKHDNGVGAAGTGKTVYERQQEATDARMRAENAAA